MSDYVIPAGATAEMLKQLADEVEVKLAEKRGAVEAAPDDVTRARLLIGENRPADFLWRIEFCMSSANSDNLRGTVESNRTQINELRDANTRQAGKIAKVREEVESVTDRLNFMESFCFQLRNTVDILDNNQRKQNILVFGLKVQRDVNPIIQTLFQAEPQFFHELDEAYFIGNDPSKKLPLKLHFKSCSGSARFFQFARTPAFGHHHLAVERDITALRKVGTSRLASASPRLKEKFLEAHITPSCSKLKLGGVTYEAIEFAALVIFIGDVEFDMDAACLANNEFEIAKTMKVEQGDTTTVGFVRKARQGLRSSSGGLQRRSAQDDDMQVRDAHGQGRGGGFGGNRPYSAVSTQSLALGGGAPGSSWLNLSLVAPMGNGVTSRGATFFAGGQRGSSNSRHDMMGAIPNPYDVRI
jgi:hypothetical protein